MPLLHPIHRSRTGRWSARRHHNRFGRVVVALAVVAGAALVAPLLSASSAGAAELTPVISNESGIVGVAFDSAGNLYVSENTGAVKVLPVVTGTIFGTPVTAGTLTTLVTVGNAPGLAFDGAGDLFLTDQDSGTVSVLARSSGTLFGTPVTADTLTPLVTGLDSPIGLAFDGAGNLYVATQNGVSVVAQSSGTIFGRTVTADTPAPILSGLGQGTFVAFDSSGDLFVSDFADDTVTVLPATTGTVFGQAVTADAPAVLLTGVTDAAGLSFDAAGDLYVNHYENVGVLAGSPTTVDGTPVPADTLTDVADGLQGDLGSTYFEGNLYVADQLNHSVDRMSTPTATVTGVTFGGTVASPVVIVNGTGFSPLPPATPPGCGASGVDYPYGALFLADQGGNSFGAGIPGDCIGLYVSEMTATRAVFTLGDFYAGFSLASGDPYLLEVDGLTVTGTVAYGPAGPAAVTGVAPATGPGNGGTKVTISGTGFSGATTVLFGSVPATSFTVNGPGTTIKAYAPAQAAGTVDVTVVAGGGVSATGPADQYAIQGPTISGLSKTSGPGNGGTKVNITGTALQGATSVLFGGQPASYTVNGPGTTIKAVTPPGAAGSADVTVVTPGGTANDYASFAYEGPTITTVTPGSGPAVGGNTVTIRGTALQGATASTVLFGSTQAESVTVNNAGTALTAVAPPEGSGTVDVSVSTPGGTADDPGAYAYVGPTVIRVTPHSGPAVGGSTVTIKGSSLQGATASTVLFGSTEAESATVNAAGTAITAVTPPGVDGPVPVTVTTPGGTSTAVTFTYQG